MIRDQDSNSNDSQNLMRMILKVLKIQTDEGVNENDENVIRPKLSPLMIEQERDAFFKELLAKWKLPN